MSTEEILRIDDERYEAMRQHNVTALSTLLHDKIIYTHSNAAFDNKADYLRKVGDGTYHYHFITAANRSVTIVGNTALVHGRMTSRADVNGQPRDIDNFAVAVWVHSDGGWSLLAYQPTIIPR